MAFVSNAEEIARSGMASVNPRLIDAYVGVIRFLCGHPEAASAMRGANAPSLGSAEYVRRQATAFATAREPRIPLPPTTVPDEMVSVILVSFFGIAAEKTERIKREHSLSMAAENLVGDLLERYLATVLEPRGWIWCSGAMIRAADFIKPPEAHGGRWRMLQVKNRDNSENSSSSAIRLGTPIEKWHRTFSRRVGSNWGAFPEAGLRQYLSEEAFITFVRNYLRNLRP